MSSDGDCSNMGCLGLYILVTTAVNLFALIVLIVVVVVALWKIYRQQSSIITWILDVDKEAGNGRFNLVHRGSPRVSRDTYAPVRSDSPGTVREELPVPQSSPNPEARGQDRSSGGQQGETKEDDSVKSKGAVGGLVQRVKPTLARKNKRSLSLPRGKAKRAHATATSKPQFDMKRITYELQKTEPFQRTSGECDDAPGPEDTGTTPSNRTLERHRDRAGDGNEYASTVISKKPDCLPPARDNTTKGDPFYFQLNSNAQENDVDTGADTRAVRGRRSMSDASFVQSAVSRFPLKMIFDKSGKSNKQRQTKKTKSEDQPLPMLESTQDNEYERINREASLVKRPRHAAVTTAESDGEYSKLKRNGTKDNGAGPAEGYDRISAGASPTSPDKKDGSKSRFSMIN
ncbi:uncharacterized protein LOC117288298 isoform X2 [Asterias rubens]|uniref:uncharacterized protein LOC117288298 isoform X2 n=1 Tax=Asterias rubens TaxID=7604 RepID=UPI00145586D3|nr:uncharacterized protein LOC117288298 isoform X2 [Asterias rubens]